MSDLDTLRARGIRAFCIVDANGVAFNGTATLTQILARGMAPLCQVNSVGTEPNSGTTASQLLSRGIASFCQINESGVDPVSGDTALQISQRGILAFVAVDTAGLVQNGTQTIFQLESRGLYGFCPVDETGTEFTLGGIVLSPSSIAENSANGTTVGTATVVISTTGTAVWSITDVTGTFQINSSSGVVTVLSNTDLDFETHPQIPVTISVSGLTPTVPNLNINIQVTNVIETPVNTVLPAISGTAVVGNTLSVSDGIWTDMAGPGAHSFAYQWKRGGVSIGGATSNSYLLVHADAGSTITCTVTATNTAGSTPATSSATASVNEAPSISVAPSISGSSVEPATLTLTQGTWIGTPSPALADQWLRNGSPIPGQTGTTYTTSSADLGDTISVAETASNIIGNASANSNSIGPITASGGGETLPHIPLIF